MCDNPCTVCRRLVVSNSITFAAGNVVINIPEAVYAAGCKYCIMLNQPMPTTATAIQITCRSDSFSRRKTAAPSRTSTGAI